MIGEAHRTIPGVADATIRFKIYDEGESRVCEIRRLDGSINLKPKAWLSLIRGELRVLENAAREAGCDEVRMSGRFTSKVLPDYTPYTALDGSPCLKKRLADG